MRTTMKGGVWKNSEDEILKAAVMKYGMNNWSRVASLLVRKSAKQCKSRWYEWLDPSVKKTEWTREEEEKLLHLAKLFPNQWRTIAPVVGRTAHQCLEHYDRLLDQAQGRGIEDRADDPRRLRPGEIDPHPETKPSRADAVDMEDDEKEMLAEARARLANTRGKKAKRKAREKQLEEARRLASLQKRRELKAAGLGVPKRKKKDDVIDYATEIPFEQPVPKGFYALPPEETPASVKGFGNVMLQQLEGQQRIHEERRLRREDTRKLKRMLDENLPEAMKLIEKLNDPQTFRKRTRLTLPQPQLTDAELYEIVDMGSRPNGMAIGTDDSHSAQLLQSAVRAPVTSLTPMRTPARENTVLLEAQNALARMEAQTPLEGGENPTLHNLGATTGATPMHNVPQTPNILMSALRGPGTIPATPFSTIAGNSTPLRDDLSLNEGGGGQGIRAMEAMWQMQVKTALNELPAPQNEIELTLPDENEDIIIENVEEFKLQEEDREDEENRKAAEIERLREIELNKRSKVIQQKLPRPLFSELVEFKPSEEYQSLNDDNKKYLIEADKTLHDTMKALIINDSIKYPLPVKGLRVPKDQIDIGYDDNLEELKEAAALIQLEQEILKGIDADDEENELEQEELKRVWDNIFEQGFYLEGKESFFFKEVSTNMQREALKKEFLILKNQVVREAQKAKKLETKLTTLTNGYSKKAKTIMKCLENSWTDSLQLDADSKSYTELFQTEQAGLINRKDYLKRLAELEEARHIKLQTHYGILLSKREGLRNGIFSNTITGQA